ncbi:MAG: DUF4446 family protein [Candidatus Vogelbacteria bacterium]|nr:DUF4446 family protein [Candidatus Vogelbacteria bacterium]
MLPLEGPYILIYALILIVVILISWIVYLEHRLNRWWRGKKASDLESVMIAIGGAIDDFETRHGVINEQLIDINRRLKKSVQKVQTLRYNPFRDQGGNQSFTTALINEEGDGVIISSIYSRDKVSVYSKPIRGLSSEYELTDEEREVLEQTKK